MEQIEHLNLTAERGPSVWDRTSLRPDADPYRTERVLFGLTAVSLVAVGLSRRTWLGGLVAGLASVLAVRAACGHHDLQVPRAWIGRAREFCLDRSGDVVGHASEESFPASDPPAWTGAAAQSG